MTDATRTSEESAADASQPWRLPVAVAAVVLAASLIPIPASMAGGDGGLGLTSAGHLLGYGALSWATARTLLDRAAPHAGTLRPVRVALAAVALAAAFGLLVELLQIPVPTRGFAWLDLGVNAAGAVGGALAYAAGVR